MHAHTRRIKHAAIALPIKHECTSAGSSLICCRSRRNDLKHCELTSIKDFAFSFLLCHFLRGMKCINFRQIREENGFILYDCRRQITISFRLIKFQHITLIDQRLFFKRLIQQIFTSITVRNSST